VGLCLYLYLRAEVRWMTQAHEVGVECQS